MGKIEHKEEVEETGCSGPSLAVLLHPFPAGTMAFLTEGGHTGGLDYLYVEKPELCEHNKFYRSPSSLDLDRRP